MPKKVGSKKQVGRKKEVRSKREVRSKKTKSHRGFNSSIWIFLKNNPVYESLLPKKGKKTYESMEYLGEDAVRIYIIV